LRRAEINIRIKEKNSPKGKSWALMAFEGTFFLSGKTERSITGAWRFNGKTGRKTTMRRKRRVTSKKKKGAKKFYEG